MSLFDKTITPFQDGSRFNIHVDDKLASSGQVFMKNTKSSLYDRVKFDPTNSEHRLAYARFVETGKWTLRFFQEEPHLSVPHTIMHKLAMHAISSELSEIKLATKN